MRSAILYYFIIAFLLIGCKQTRTSQRHDEKNKIVSNGFSSIESFQQGLIEDGITGSNVAMIYKDGAEIYRHIENSHKAGDTEITDRSIFPIWSMSKPVTTVAMMILYEEGLFKLDDPVSEFIPVMSTLKCLDEDGEAYNCKNTLTIKHLLAHRSGWSYDLIYFRNLPLLITDTLFTDLADLTHKVAMTPLEHEPGTQYTYGINTALLGRLIEVISNKPFDVFLKEKIFDPLGMTDTKFYLKDGERSLFRPLYRTDEGDPYFVKDAYDELSYAESSNVWLGGEGLVSTIDDYGRFAEMLLNGGELDGTRTVAKTSIELMHRKHSESEDGFFYGFSMFHLENPFKDRYRSPEGIFGWSGYHNTHFWVDPANNLYAIFMTRKTPYDGNIQKRFRKAVYQAVDQVPGK